MALAVGDRAPDFTLESHTGGDVTLSELRGQFVVLYFYPKDETPGCTKEACDFQGCLPSFAGLQAAVLGVSRDDRACHQRFAEKFRLAFPLVSDPDASACKAYGVYKQKSMYGRTYWGIERTTFVIDGQGRIAAIFPKVAVDGHVAAVLETLKASAPAPRRAVARRTSS